MNPFTSYFRSLFSRFPEADVIVGMVLILAIVVWELLGVFDGKYLTLTDWIKSWMPLWARCAILGWLIWHFVLSDIYNKVRGKG